MSLPVVTVTGTLTADPDLRYTNSGKAVATFSVASNSRRKNQATGQYEDGETTYLRGQVWGAYAENVVNSLNRGQRVILTGQLRQREYTTKEGQTRTSFEVDVSEIGPTLRFQTAAVAKTSAAQHNAPSRAAEPAGW